MSLIVYGTNWCGDCRFAKKYLEEVGIPFQFISIESLDASTIQSLIEANDGEDWAAPTFFMDGRSYACPKMNKDIFQEVLNFYSLNKISSQPR